MGVRLPSAYQETEYIESTGAQWIDTGIVYGKFVHDIAFTADGRQLMGCHSTSTKFWGSKENKACYELHSSRINTDTGKRNIVIYDNTNDPTTSLTAAGVTKTETITGPNPLPSYVLFRINNENYYASARLYHISIYDIADDLIYDGIPCYRKSDSVAGLYDLVGRTFYPNQGTGSFLVGPDVIDSISPLMVAWRQTMMSPKQPRLPAEYQEVEYIESTTGGQTIAIRDVSASEFDVSITTDVYWKNVTSKQLHGADARRYFGVVNGYYQVGQAGYSHTDLVAVINQWQHVSFSRNKFLCTFKVDNDEREVKSAAAASNPTGFRLFGIGESAYYNCLCRLKRTLVIIEDDRYDLIPCYRKSDNKPGMYDLVSNTFFTNAGTGEFVVGADVN